MKKPGALILFLALTFFLQKVVAQNAPLEIELFGLRSEKGHVLVSLFKADDGFPDDPSKAIQKQRVAINNNKAIVKFNSIPNGVYAVAVLHDENDDMKMDKNFVGIPKEGYGFSNNVMRLTGPPSFKEASFDLSKTKKIEIKVKY